MSRNKLLSDVAYAALKPKDKEYRMADISGLYMKVQTSGKKSWQLRLKNNEGKWTWVGLGSYPEVSVKIARSQALKYQSGELQIVTRTERLKQALRDESELFEKLMRDWIDTKKILGNQRRLRRRFNLLKSIFSQFLVNVNIRILLRGNGLNFFRQSNVKTKYLIASKNSYHIVEMHMISPYLKTKQIITRL